METQSPNPVILRPPFTRETALQKVRLAENAWNSRNPERVSLAYTPDSLWRNRSEFLQGREEIQKFLTRKWAREIDYRLVKSLWAYTENHIAVRFQYEYRTADGNWFRAYGNENWEFDEAGLMQRREASINDVAILPEERRFFWEAPGNRPLGAPGIPELR